jgi:hypothetical protein
MSENGCLRQLASTEIRVELGEQKVYGSESCGEITYIPVSMQQNTVSFGRCVEIVIRCITAFRFGITV